MLANDAHHVVDAHAVDAGSSDARVSIDAVPAADAGIAGDAQVSIDARRVVDAASADDAHAVVDARVAIDARVIPDAAVASPDAHVNRAPVASDQSVSLDENSELGITLSATDADADFLTYTVGEPSHGSLSGIAPALTYTPALDFHGDDSFTFTVNDGTVDSNTATVSITVNHINQPPVATPQTVSVDENSATSITLAGTDVDNNSLTFTVVSSPSNGQLTGTAPNLTYTPTTDFHGSDSFTFKTNDGNFDSSAATVSITVNHINQAPVASGQSPATNEGNALGVTLAATDVDGDSLTFTVVTSPTNGIVTGTAPNLTYTPNANYFGADSFTFKANDSVLDSNVATVSITVNQYNTVGMTDSLDAGLDHTCVIINGGVQCWGLNSDGQLGNNSTTNSFLPGAVTGITSGVEAISTGGRHTCALVNGGVQCWGLNTNGQLGNNSTNSSSVPVPVTGLTSGVQALSSGNTHTCALVNGGVHCWGSNNRGQLGDGTTQARLTPVAVTGLTSNVTAIATGDEFTCAIQNGGVQCWGRNVEGELGNGGQADAALPVQVTGLTSNVQAIAAGGALGQHACALSNGGVSCWGQNSFGEVGDNSTATSILVPDQVVGLTSGVSAIVAGEDHSCAIVNGGAQCWGLNTSGQLGNNSTTSSLVPVQVAGLTSGVQELALGGVHTCALVNGGVQCWGRDVEGELGNNSTTESPVPVQVTGIVSGVQQIADGGQSSCALISGGVQCWGGNGAGQLGNNSTTASPVPVHVQGMTSGVQAISVNNTTACAIQNGAAWCWGNNVDGGLGNNSTTNSPVPVQVTGLTSGVQAISVGSQHTCAIVNGGVQCWGFNGHGQLGNLTQTNSLVPVTFSTVAADQTTLIPLSGVTQLVTGQAHTCALLNGGVLCAGAGVSIGDDSTFNSQAAGGVVGLDPGSVAGVQAIAGTVNTTCALVNGGMQCWGINANGQLGNGTTTTNSLVPVPVTGLTSGVRMIGANSKNSCATVDAGIFCWGDNTSGQLGNNTTVSSSLPVAVLGLSGAAQLLNISAIHMSALVNGAEVSWGDNTFGELGDNTTTNRLEPTAMATWAP